MQTLVFDNLISAKTGKTLTIEVSDDFDMEKFKYWGEKGKKAGARMKKACEEHFKNIKVD